MRPRVPDAIAGGTHGTSFIIRNAERQELKTHWFPWRPFHAWARSYAYDQCKAVLDATVWLRNSEELEGDGNIRPGDANVQRGDRGPGTEEGGGSSQARIGGVLIQ
jgi:hypothetical protein